MKHLFINGKRIVDFIAGHEGRPVSRRFFLKSLLSAAALSVILPSRGQGAGGGAGGTGQTKKPLVIRVKSKVIDHRSFSPERYLDAIDGAALEAMVREALWRLTGRKTAKESWQVLLRDYRPGDSVAIKPNFNFINHGTRYTITAPQLIDAVVAQLVDEMGMSPSKIFVYDLCKFIPHDTVRRRIRYPVNYVERIDTSTVAGKIRLRLRHGPASPDTSEPIVMRRKIYDEDKSPVTCYVPRVLTYSDHLINMPLLTNHIYIANSGALKNHYGTVRFSNLRSYPVVLHGSILNSAITDINLNSHIAGKTRVIIADAIFGVYDRGEGEGKRPWKTLGGFPESIIVARDPVAVDSVMASLVVRERSARGLPARPHDYLEEAARMGLGVFELRERDRSFKRIDFREINL